MNELKDSISLTNGIWKSWHRFRENWRVSGSNLSTFFTDVSTFFADLSAFHVWRARSSSYFIDIKTLIKWCRNTLCNHLWAKKHLPHTRIKNYFIGFKISSLVRLDLKVREIHVQKTFEIGHQTLIRWCRNTLCICWYVYLITRINIFEKCESRLYYFDFRVNDFKFDFSSPFSSPFFIKIFLSFH